MQLIEAEVDGAVASVVVHLDLAGLEVDRSHLVLHADVDALLVAELLGRASHQVVEVRHVTADEVRNPACGVARPVALLERNDVEVGVAAPRLRSRRHAACVPADHDQSFRHGAGHAR